MPATLASEIGVPVREGILSQIVASIVQQGEDTYLELNNATIVANIQGGAHNRSVRVRSKPIVALSVGKNALKDNETTMLVNASAIHHTFQSVKARYNPDSLDKKPRKSLLSSLLSRRWASS